MDLLSTLFGGNKQQAGALGAAGGGMGASSFLQLLPAIMAGLKGLNTHGQEDTTGQLQHVTNAMYNPSNPLYQQLYGQNKQMLQQNMGNAVSQAEGQNRSAAAAGRVPLFSPERNGEVAFRTMVQGQGAAGQAAQEQTHKQLGDAGTLLARGLYPLQQTNTENQFGNTALNLGGYQSIADLLRKGGY